MNETSSARKWLIGAVFGLLAAIVFGLFWFFFLGPETPVGFGWYAFSFAAGLTMIILPCTLPLAFVIVPLSMGKGPAKGLMIALAFGIGVAATLSMYGVLAAIVGKVAIGSLNAPLELVKNWLYFAAGAFAYLFALGELGLVHFKMPSYTGAFPGFIQRQQDVFKALLLGLFLGNVGVGCPHPATPVLLTRIAAEGDILYGWLLFLVHAIGRVLPLLFLAFLGILGVNALQSLVSKKDKIERATGWMMVFVAAFILCLGLFSHDWWVLSGMHTYLEDLTQEHLLLTITADRLGAENVHAHGMPPAGATGLFGLPLAAGSWVLLALWIIPLFWAWRARKTEVQALPEAEKPGEEKLLRSRFWNAVTLSLLLVLVFGYLLPHRFAERAGGGHPAGTADDHSGMVHGGHEGMVHSEDEVKEGLTVYFSAAPAGPRAGSSTQLEFFVNEQPSGDPIPADWLELEHERKMHVIGMRKDLQDFFHVHPQPGPEPARFLVSHAFPRSGEYHIWSEVKYEGVNHTIAHNPLMVLGNEADERRSGPPAYDPQKELATTKIAGNYQVALHYGDLFTGSNEVGFTIKDAQGRPAILDNYLGAQMHLAVVSEDLSEFIHAHPGSAGADDGHGHEHSLLEIPVARADEGHAHGEMAEGAVPFQIAFPRPGYYKMFAQFRPQGYAPENPDAYLLAQFWVQVEQRPAGLDSWWTKLIVSLVLMAGLSWFVKRYISIPEAEGGK